MSFRRQEGKVQALDRHVQALELRPAARLFLSKKYWVAVRQLIRQWSNCTTA